VTDPRIKLFRFDTSRHTPDDMAAQILDAFAQTRRTEV
jgi:hypothetical protein